MQDGARILTLEQIAADSKHQNCAGARSTQHDNIQPKLSTLALLLDCALEACTRQALFEQQQQQQQQHTVKLEEPADNDDQVDWVALSVHAPHELWAACETMLMLSYMQLQYVKAGVFHSLWRLVRTLSTHRLNDELAVLTFWWLVWAYDGCWLMVRETLPPASWSSEDSVQLLRTHIDHHCKSFQCSVFRVDNVHRYAQLFRELLAIDVHTRHFALARTYAAKRKLSERTTRSALKSASVAAAQQKDAAAIETLRLSGFAPPPVQRRNAIGCTDDPSEHFIEALTRYAAAQQRALHQQQQHTT